MEHTQTAEDFLLNFEQEYFEGAVFGEFAYKHKEVCKAMIEFAKLHVKVALKAAHQNQQLPIEDLEYTMDAYPLNLIK